MKQFAISVVAFKEDSYTWQKQMINMLIFREAVSEEEAIGMGHKFAEKSGYAQNEWSVRMVLALEIPGGTDGK